MSNFEVGDRVVVVGSNNTFRGQRGPIVEVVEESPWPYTVKLPDEVNSTPVPYSSDELELEGVYDALSAKPVEEPLSVEDKLDSRGKAVEAFLEMAMTFSPEEDAVNHPSHYADGWTNGAEVIDITEHLNFNRGNAVKYLSRAGKKGGPEKELEDLQKALWYVSREVERLGGTID